MVKEILQSIDGVAIYPIAALLLFVVSFVLAIVAVWRMNPGEVEHCSRLPLSDSVVSEREAGLGKENSDSGEK